MINLKVGDLVQEKLPLAAGDAPERLGIVTQVPTRIGKGFVKILFDTEEVVHYNSLRKMEG
jgi:hypothetical protein